ncbi:MAG: response regulator [Treponema sp.]|jgi:signal transduction histidine kinase/CheY-like chemotaxis protein|nr:response regulator [Treponema sp.]
MAMNIRWKEVIKKNYPQVFFVFAAFLVMVLAGYFFVSGILRNRILTNAGDNLFSAEANIRAAFAESEISLNTSFPVVLGMIQRNAPQEEILDYLKATTAWMRQNRGGLMEFLGIYGYIRGEFMNGLDYRPDEDFIPQTRPWYQTAVRAGGGSVAYTAPYRDTLYGETVISAVKNIVDQEGNYHGILVIDMTMEWINEYIRTLRLGNGGYGMIVNQNMVIMTHPDENAQGKQLQELGGPFGDISRRLRLGEEISALRYDSAGEGRVIAFFRRMFNGWYVGLITPTSAYYRELRSAAYILSALGFVLMCALSYLLLRMSVAKMRADENSLSKSSFLAKMSHEIRTPMNAIIGMSELILREKLDPGARNYADNIRQAGSNLLAIINDILDFSKIESGKLDIINAEYHFASIINDVITISKMRFNEKPIHFITRIDGSLPAVLVGDEVRVRQVLLNLLTNAVKYTNEGSITFSIRRGEDPDETAKSGGEAPRIFLAFEIADTGIGIKKEDMEKLFGDFTQFDQKQNRGVEGTGLGLVISRNLCSLMGGNISVKSDYGRGSVFTALIPQLVRNPGPFATVEHPETKTSLIYDDRPLYAESLAYTIESLGVSCIYAHTGDDVRKSLNSARFIFTSPARLEEVREILRNRSRALGAEASLAGKPGAAAEPEAGVPEAGIPALILFAENRQAGQPDVQTIFTPLQPGAAANILNGQQRDKGFHEAENPGVRFIAPGVRVLVVDDIVINLDVAQGLLSPYRMTIDQAAGGLEAVRMVREKRYDLILMDHMMPDMDGVEAVAVIRKWEEEQRIKKSLEFPKETPGNPPGGIPIIALTANAISGMKEMFLEKGFSDYLSKPIEIAKLDEMLARWIPPEKRIKTGAAVKRETFSGDSALSIPGVDVKRGINMTGGTEAGYRKVLAQFYKDAADRLSVFTAFSGETGDGPERAEKTTNLTIQVHALKSAAGTIGAAEVSAEAAALEAAGKAGDIKTISETLPGFCKDLTELIREIGKALEKGKEKKEAPPGGGRRMADTLSALRAMLETKNMKETDRLLAELEAAADAETAEQITNISDKVLMGEYQKAIDLINILFGVCP